MNADGWGVGFFAVGRPEPVRWRSDRPLWADQSLASVAPVISSPCMVAPGRSASAGMPADETAVPPLPPGLWLRAHHGAAARGLLAHPPAAAPVSDARQL